MVFIHFITINHTRNRAPFSIFVFLLQIISTPCYQLVFIMSGFMGVLLPCRVCASVHTCAGECLLSVCRAYKVRSRLILQILAPCSSAACILVQSRWPQIHSAKALIEPQLLADKVNFSPYALPWKTQPCSVCRVTTQSTSYDSHKSQWSMGTSPHWAICSNLTLADNAQVRSVHCSHSAIKLTSVLLDHKGRSIFCYIHL